MSTDQDDDGFRALRVTGIERDTADSVVVTFAAPSGWSFAHGQHLVLRRYFDGVEVRRSYSLCSPAPTGAARVSIKRVDGGVFSNWATAELDVGDHVDVLGPTGHFTHELDVDRSDGPVYALVAAGSGITPIFSIAATILSHEPTSQVRLVYVNRSSTSTMLVDDLEDLRDRALDRFSIAYLFTREPSDAEMLSGRPDRARFDRLIEAGFLPADADQAFLCGPLDMVDIAREALIDAGVPAERIHRELFTGGQLGSVRSTAPQVVDDTTSVVATGVATLHGRDSMFTVYEGDSVLDAVQRVRPDAPFSCRSGVCSTCQARLVAGDVDMAVNYGLEQADLDRRIVLTCQSTPTSADLTVDYDV